jgi:hypothetical protein
MADRKTGISEPFARINVTLKLHRGEVTFALAWQLFGK